MERDNNMDMDTTVKVMRLAWEPRIDMLTFPQPPARTTKRDVVKHTSSLFYSLGLVSPVHIKAKIFVQSIYTYNGVRQWMRI